MSWLGEFAKLLTMSSTLVLGMLVSCKLSTFHKSLIPGLGMLALHSDYWTSGDLGIACCKSLYS